MAWAEPIRCPRWAWDPGRGTAKSKWATICGCCGTFPAWSFWESPVTKVPLALLWASHAKWQDFVQGLPLCFPVWAWLSSLLINAVGYPFQCVFFPCTGWFWFQKPEFFCVVYSEEPWRMHSYEAQIYFCVVATWTSEFSSEAVHNKPTFFCM